MDNFDLNTLDTRAQTMKTPDGGEAQITPAISPLPISGTLLITSKRCL